MTDNPPHFATATENAMASAPRDGTYINILVPREIGSHNIHHVYWCDEAQNWAVRGKPLPVVFTDLVSSWTLSDDAPDPMRALGRAG